MYNGEAMVHFSLSSLKDGNVSQWEYGLFIHSKVLVYAAKRNRVHWNHNSERGVAMRHI